MREGEDFFIGDERLFRDRVHALIMTTMAPHEQDMTGQKRAALDS